jgi:hypothetical protein
MYLRSLVVKTNAVLELKLNGVPIRSVKQAHVQPSEMINVTIGPNDFPGQKAGIDSVLEFNII